MLDTLSDGEFVEYLLNERPLSEIELQLVHRLSSLLDYVEGLEFRLDELGLAPESEDGDT